MDELFQRAAEKFPLKEPDNHWNSIQSKLIDGNTQPAHINSKWPIMLYALLAIICLHLPLMLIDNVYRDKKIVESIVLGSNGELEGFQQHNRDTNEEELVIANNVTIKTGNDVKAINHTSIIVENARQNAEQAIQLSNAFHIMMELADSSTNNEMVFEPEQENWKKNSSEIIQERNLQAEILIDNDTLLIDATARNILPETVTTKVAKKPIKKPSTGLYAGINTGISFSIVKAQHLSTPGFTAGVGLGYRFSPTWSAETGMKFSEKKYYSNGAYFSKRNIPPDMKVVSVNSRTLLFEIPIKAKYDFGKTSKGQYFLTGGLSTFIVGKEINDYIIYRDGINSPKHAVYNENQSYLAASIEVSAGYELYIKSKQTLRIEPWIQIARKGIGIGQLPVSGFGMQAGYFFLR